MSLLRRTILLTLSLLVLLSSSGFSMGVHFCGEVLQNWALFHKAEACPMEQQKPLPCHGGKQEAPAKQAADDMDCCEDNLVVADGVDDAVTSKDPASLKKPQMPLLAVLHTALLFLQAQAVTEQAVFSSYFPPPLIRDIPVLVQSFLI